MGGQEPAAACLEKVQPCLHAKGPLVTLCDKLGFPNLPTCDRHDLNADLRFFHTERKIRWVKEAQQPGSHVILTQLSSWLNY